MSKSDDQKHLVVFQNKSIRRTWHDGEWFFAVVDIVAVLTDSVNPSDYIKKIRSRDPVLSKGWGQIVTPLPIETAGGMQKINCANVKGLFRHQPGQFPAGRQNTRSALRRR